MKIYCLYGHGKPTERAYFYQHDAFDASAQENGNLAHEQCSEANQTCQSAKQDFPLNRRPPYIDTNVNLDHGDTVSLSNPFFPVFPCHFEYSYALPEQVIRNGVMNGDGDGTVGLLSLGA